tara:strand:+ start:345 stop:836 length:492 start_codon:yes stop_codon:yes gene_type:complete
LSGYANRTTYKTTIDSISTAWFNPQIIFRIRAGQTDRLLIQQGNTNASFYYYDYNLTTGVSSSVSVSMGSVATFPASWEIVLYDPVVIADASTGQKQVYFDWEIVLNGTIQIESLTGSTRNYNPALFRLFDFCLSQELSIGAVADSFKLYVSEIKIDTNNACP